MHYETLKEAMSAVARLGIQTKSEYNRRYKEDPKLPACPHNQYSGYEQQGGAAAFFSKTKYSTLEEAKAAVERLGIKTCKEYKQRYKEDPRLRSGPSDYPNYNKCGGHRAFFGIGSFYPTLEEARTAVKALNINSTIELDHRNKEDPRLPSNPSGYYPDYTQKGGPNYFFSKPSLYTTLDEARASVEKLGISSRTEYRTRYKEDPRLPSNPSEYYPDYAQNGGQKSFLAKGKSKVEPTLSAPREIIKPQSVEVTTRYTTLALFYDAVHRLNITSIRQYFREYRNDGKLPSDPPKYYSGYHAYGGSRFFFNTKYPTWQDAVLAAGSDQASDLKLLVTPYGTVKEASAAAQALGITSVKDYFVSYTDDPRLPGNPRAFYSDNYRLLGCSAFFGKREKYETLKEASEATRRLKLDKKGDYAVRYKEDPRLPSNPHIFYPNFYDEGGFSTYFDL